MIVTVVGLGLIGGSLALDLKARKFATRVIGVDNNSVHSTIALQKGIVDEILELEAAVRSANLVIIAIPVNTIVQLLPKIINYCNAQTVVTDMGSTKYNIVQAIKHHPKRGQYVASHPMAGTEYSGPTAAIYNLFDGKVAIICDQENTNEQALQVVKNMYRTLQMPLLYMNAKEHDIHVAYVSHISHISSFVLATTVLEKEKNDANIFNLASGGFASTVRLAKSSPTMWAQIFEQNKDNLLEVIDTYLVQLNLWRTHIANNNFLAVKQTMQEANVIRRILDTPPIERLKNVITES